MKALHQTPCWHLHDMCDSGNAHACRVYDEKKCGDRVEKMTSDGKRKIFQVSFYTVIAVVVLGVGMALLLAMSSSSRGWQPLDDDEEDSIDLTLVEPDLY